MPRTSLDDVPCSWAKAATAVCDQWSILIIRDAFRGVRTYSAFLRSTGMSRNVLTRRLAHLVDHEVMGKRAIGVDSTSTEYYLTKKGEGLFPLMVALGQWSDTWNVEPTERLWVLADSKDQKPIRPLIVQADDGRELAVEDVQILPGPGHADSVAKTEGGGPQ